MILKCIFVSICAFQKTKVKRCFAIVFFYFTVFVLKNAKNQRFEENKGLGALFYRIELQVVTNRSSRLEKTQTLFAYYRLFTNFF